MNIAVYVQSETINTDGADTLIKDFKSYPYCNRISSAMSARTSYPLLSVNEFN